MSHQIEQTVSRGETLDKELFLQHRGFVIGAVLTSGAFLEASINEIYANNASELSFTDMSDDHRRAFGWLPEEIRGSFAAIWQSPQFQKSFGLLEKYDLALRLSLAAPLRGTKPYEDIPLLLLLRNELIHYKAAEVIEGVVSEQEIRKLQRKLRDKFKHNPMLVQARNRPTIFPAEFLHHACARWAVLSSLDFMDAFCERIGIPPRRYDRSVLTPDWSGEQEN
jgi:hypothetical protein